MSRADCFRALGVDPDASWEAIRQAYKDLVRVWHPDRFQSDPELQERAEQQLKRINEAYFTLKNSHVDRGRPPEPAPQPEQAEPDPTAGVGPRTRAGPRPHARPHRFSWNLQFRWPIRAAWLGLMCLAALVTGNFPLKVLQVPTLDSPILRDGQSRPVMPMPSRLVSPFGGRPATADELSSWARGEAMDLWKSIPKIGERKIGETGDVPSRDQPRQQDTRAVAPGTPANGTELLRTRMSGGSELWISNQTNRDAVATLVEADKTAPLRVVYIQAKNKVCIRHIARGLYDLLAETGENWDPKHVRFQTNRHALARRGPFQCVDLTSAQGTYGLKFQVVLEAR
jgi:hypothetical protein